MGDKVNHPDHYQNIAGVEAIDILNDVVKDLPGKQAAMLWNAMKYLLRFQNKNGVEDLKKARNYLDYLIADMDSVCNAAEQLWATWYSNEYGYVWIFAGTNPKGMPTKLIFETKDAAEEFKSVFYNMLSEGYDEFSIADACLEMKFKFTKRNRFNNWDELVSWEKVHDRFDIKEADGKYELIFVHKDSSSKKEKTPKHISEEMQPMNDKYNLYKSTVWGNAEVYYSANMPEGTCTKIVFDDKGDRDTFAIKFFRYLSYNSHRFSIRDILEDAKYMFSKEDDNLSVAMPWNKIFKGFHITDENGKYVLELIIDLQGGK